MKPAIVYRLGKHDEEFSLVQHQDRMRQIANTLARHGLGYLVGILGLKRFVPFHRG